MMIRVTTLNEAYRQGMLLLVQCWHCDRKVLIPPHLYLKRAGNLPFAFLSARLKCAACGVRRPSIEAVPVVNSLEPSQLRGAAPRRR